ncbi:hypothetical protein ElyMa_005822600 [Elysia marginata]|uniref:Uncharacterized protein n=1 Tax=Elysia marginata TaxID=1093978 RepID=A0AAV4FWP0_9GAST|nr:hypothetical protein ElyMa_005822600 [Elysia marginata]
MHPFGEIVSIASLSTAELEEACRVAAQEIGRDWPGMPLSPRRDPCTGKPDISGSANSESQIISTRQQAPPPRGGVGGGGLLRGAKAGNDRNKKHGPQEVGVVIEDDDCPTYRSLDRWQRVSQEASGNALGRVTRSIKTVRRDPDMIASGGAGGKQELKIITVN